MKRSILITALLMILLLSACSLPIDSLFAAPNEVATLSPSGWDEELLSQEDAKLIALDHAKLSEEDITGLYVAFEYDDGKPEYEVQFRSQRFQYEYEIHGISGRIISCEREK